MTDTFDAGLRDMAQRAAQAHAHDGGFPTSMMVTRARRGRRRAAATTGAVAVLTVTGIVAAGFAVAGVRHGDEESIQPAQTTTPSPTTTPTPTTAPDALPLLPPDDHSPARGVSAIPATDGSLADGDYLGTLDAISGPDGTVTADLEVIYGGQAAIDWLTANDPTAENPPSNDYFILNEVTQPQPLTLSPDVQVWDWCSSDNGIETEERTPDQWAAAPVDGTSECGTGAALSRGGTYWFDIRDGVVMQIIGQYLP